MYKWEKEKLMDILEKIDGMQWAVEVLEEGYGVNVASIYVEDEELSLVKIDTDAIRTNLGNLSDIIKQYIKEEEAYDAR